MNEFTGVQAYLIGALENVSVENPTIENGGKDFQVLAVFPTLERVRGKESNLIIIHLEHKGVLYIAYVRMNTVELFDQYSKNYTVLVYKNGTKVFSLIHKIG